MSKNAGSPGRIEPVGVDVRVRRAALAGDGVDPLDVLGAEVVEHLADQADALVLAHARAQERVQLLVGGVDHGAGLGEQRDLVAGLDPAGLEEHLLAVDDRRCPSRCSATRTGISTMSTPIGSPVKPVLAQLRRDLAATSSAIPASGWKAPRRVEIPARAPEWPLAASGAVVGLRSSSSHGL